jgi:signal transduction histidine kinase/ligand-binding sensor domain-containing protein
VYFTAILDFGLFMTKTTTPKIVLIQRFFFFLIALLTPFMVHIDAFAQSNPELGFPLITNYSPKTYKGHGQVWSVIQDNRGVMYFGTSAGIIEYDGVNWSQVRIADSDVFQTIRSFVKDSNGQIYFGGGQNFGYLQTDIFGNTKAISLLGLVPDEYRDFSDIRSVQISGESIYIQAREYLFRFEPSSEKTNRGIKVWKADTYFAYSFNFGGELYVFQLDKGLYQLKNEQLELVPGAGIFNSTRIYIMLPLPEDKSKGSQYIVGTSNDGFYRFDGTKFTRFKTEIDQILFNQFLYRGMVLPDGNFLVSVIGKGVFEISPEGRLIQKIDYESGLRDESVYFPYMDTSGMLWLGLDNGISKVELKSGITTFSKETGLKSGVLSIDRFNNNLIIGTPIGISVLNKGKRVFENIDIGIGTQVFDLLVEGDDLIFGTAEGLVVLKKDLKTTYELVDNRLRATVFLKSKIVKDRIFVGNTFGLSVIKRSENGFKWEKEGYFPGNFYGVWTLAESKEGDIWAGTQSGIAYKITPVMDNAGNLDFANSKIETFGGENDNKAGDGVIYGISGKIYGLAENGLFSYNPQTGKFDEDSTFGEVKIDYSSTDNFTMNEDEQGRVWITIKNSIRLAIPLPTGGYEFKDDLFNDYPWEDITNIFPEEGGTVWLGSGDGLVRMEEKEGQNELDKFSVILRQAITKKDTLSVTAPKGFSLENNNNSLRFMYAAPFFEQEERTRYQTFLEGFDPDWSDWGDNSYKEYTNLASGTYTFRVRAKNLYNVISDEATYTFTILSPWYATWWAYLVYLLILGFLIFLIDRFQRKRLLAKLYTENREKELAQAKEIQKAYENLKATQEQLIQQEKLASLGQLTAGIAHEIKNPLNFVNNFSELSMEYIEEIFEEMEKFEQSDVTDDIRALLNDVKSNLSKILQHGSRADGIVKSMLMHSRGGKGIMEPTDLNELVKEYVNLAFHGMRANKNPINVDIKLQLDENLPKVKINPEDFSRVILNLCKNAFDAMRDKTYENPNGYLPKLTVRTKDLDDNLILEVEDNGPGIAEEFRDKLLMPFFTTKKGTEGTGLGLSITHDIIKAHEGTLEINSDVGNFTRFSIMLKKE